MNNDRKTTLLGFGASGLIGTTIDPGKLVALDHMELVKAGLMVLVGLFGYFTNKHKAA